MLQPPRVVRPSAIPPAPAEAKASSSISDRNTGNPGRSSSSKDFILPKYANNRIPAKPGVKTGCSGSQATSSDGGERRKLPTSNLLPPCRVIEGRIAKPSVLKSEVTCRSQGQRCTSRRPQSLLLCSSSTSCDHLNASSSSLFSASSTRIRKRSIPVYSSLAKDASVAPAIRLASRDRKIGSIVSQRQESTLMRPNERRGGWGEAIESSIVGPRKPPQSVAKVTPFPLTKKACDEPSSPPAVIRTNDGKESSEQQPRCNRQSPTKKEQLDQEVCLHSAPRTDSPFSDNTPSSEPHPSDREANRNPDPTASMHSMSLMIASYKVKSRKMSERLDDTAVCRLDAHTRLSSDDSYSDSECSRRKTLTTDHSERLSTSSPKSVTLGSRISSGASGIRCPSALPRCKSRDPSCERAGTDVGDERRGSCRMVSEAVASACSHTKDIPCSKTNLFLDARIKVTLCTRVR